MRILLATSFSLPHVGGLWSYVTHLRDSLIKNGDQVYIFSHTPNMKSYYFLNSGRSLDKSKVKAPIYMNMNNYFLRKRPDISRWVRWREIERYSYEAALLYFGLDKYDLIHAQDVVAARALWRVKPRRTPMITTIHGCLATEHLITGNVRSRHTAEWKYAVKEDHYGALSSHKTIVPTEWLKQMYTSKFNVPQSHIEVIPNGINISGFLDKMEYGTTVKIPKDRKLLLCPARLVQEKGHSSLLRALALLKKSRKDWVCWLLGDGPLRGSLQAQVNNLGLRKDVQLLGTRKDLPAILKHAYAVVLPSFQDNLPYAVMEAQIAGKPIVASDVGGIPEMIQHGFSGLIFPKGDAKALASQLSAILDNPLLASQLGGNAKQWGRNYWPIEKMISRTLQMYQQVKEVSK